MKKFLIVGAVVFAAGAGWYFLKGKPGGISVSKTYTAKGLKAVIDLGIPVKCSYQVGDLEYEGYVKGHQWRGTMQDATGRQTEVILKDNCMWSWSTEQKQGAKMCFQLEEGKSIWDEWDDPEQQTIDTDLEYVCRPAAITDAKFIPPTDIDFMDLDQLMPGSLDMDTNSYDIPDMPDTSEDYNMPDNLDIPDSPEDFDMSRYQEP